MQPTLEDERKNFNFDIIEASGDEETNPRVKSKKYRKRDNAVAQI